jgi:hypothetical protein
MRLSWLAAALALCTGCKSPPCASVPEMDALLAQAVLVKVDVYNPTQAQCADGFVAAQAAPVLSQTFPGGADVRLNIPAGDRIIAMTTFSDAEGKVPTGSACTEANLSGGQGACLSLTLSSIDGGGCSPSNDTCPAGQYCGSQLSCQAGCKSSTDCTMPMLTMCDPNRHQCVECLAAGDCAPGQLCSPSGACTQNCSPTVPCAGTKSCCTNLCVDTQSDPLNCNGCNMPCTGSQTLCCSSQCTDPTTSTAHCGGCGNVCNLVNATAATCTSGTCGYTCASGFLDCIKTGANTDGCESSSNNVNSCGGCAPCDTTHSIGASCSAGTCMYTGCMSGYEDCNKTAPNTNGCEFATPTHMNGLGQTYTSPCAPLGTPGSMATYSSAMATAARAAATQLAGTDSNMVCMGNPPCLARSNGTMCAVWCYAKNGTAGYVSLSSTCTCPVVGMTGTSTWN